MEISNSAIGNNAESSMNDASSHAYYHSIVSNDANTLFTVPLNYRTFDICMAAVKRDGLAYRSVPPILRTAKLRLTAVQQNMVVLEELTFRETKEVMALLFVEFAGSFIQHVPEYLHTPEICLEAVKNDGYALEHIRSDLRTLEICLAAVKTNGRVLEYVPVRLRTAEVCWIAIKQCGETLEFVPREICTWELCLAAVQRDGWALQYVPVELRT
jgi:hypothetical protein